jgi:hypothetical protein
MLPEYIDVIPLVHNPGGWNEQQVNIRMVAAPAFPYRDVAIARTQEQRSSMGDTNGDKAAVKSLTVTKEGLDVELSPTEYFILWGIPGAAAESHQQALRELAEKQATEIPMGVSTHNLVIVSDPITKEISIAMVLNDSRHGFAPGRISPSFEGQMDPTIDLDPQGIPSTFTTVRRTLKEEYGFDLPNSPVTVDHSKTRLAAVCAEKGSAYTSWCHLIFVEASSKDIIDSYIKAPRRKDADALLIVPLAKIAEINRPEITDEELRTYQVAGTLEEDTIFKFHPTAIWRFDVLKDYFAQIKNG